LNKKAFLASKLDVFEVLISSKTEQNKTIVAAQSELCPHNSAALAE
jgi:hypothetical protein